MGAEEGGEEEVTEEDRPESVADDEELAGPNPNPALASDAASIALFLYLFSFSPFNKVTHLLTLLPMLLPPVLNMDSTM